MKKLPVSALSFAVALFAGTAAAQTPTKVADGMLTDSAGMTLYTFDKDVVGSGKSVCNGPCATNWPPLTAQDSDKASGGLQHRHPRRRQEAVGTQRQAALHLDQG